MSYRPGDYTSGNLLNDWGFKECADFVIDVLEGGDRIVADPIGGVTKYGISQKAHPLIDVVSLTREGALAIQQQEYWLPAGCDVLRWPLNLVAYDTAINHGTPTAIEMRLKAYNWAELILDRMKLYGHLRDRNPDAPFRGWIDRLILLYEKAKGG